MIPPSSLAALGAAFMGALDGRVVASATGHPAGAADDYGQPTGPAGGTTTLLDAPCAVVSDRLEVDRAASGDPTLAGADAVVNVDRAGALLGAPEGATLTVTYGPADERVTRSARLQGVKHGAVFVSLFAVWTSPSAPAAP